MAYGKLRNLVCGAACAVALVVALTVAPPHDTARSTEDELVYLKYDIYSSGLRIATLKIFINYSATTYQLTARMQTKGLLDIFSSSEFEAQTQGTLDRTVADPQRFDLETDSSKGERRTVITWNSEDVPLAERDHHLADYRVADIAEHSTPGILDPLTGLFNASLGGTNALCVNSFRVYDGRTIYDLAYSMLQRDDFVDGDPGVYRGEAYQCQIVYRPVAGLSEGRLADLGGSASNGEETYKVWMAPVNSPVLGRTVHVAVATVGSYKGNQFYMYLDQASIAGQALNAQSSTGG